MGSTVVFFVLWISLNQEFYYASKRQSRLNLFLKKFGCVINLMHNAIATPVFFIFFFKKRFFPFIFPLNCFLKQPTPTRVLFIFLLKNFVVFLVPSVNYYSQHFQWSSCLKKKFLMWFYQ